jgi:hypothetical protein
MAGLMPSILGTGSDFPKAIRLNGELGGGEIPPPERF